MAKIHPLIKRKEAIDKVMARFGSKEFKLGSVDCMKMFKFHMTNMGHKLPSTGNYKTELEAARVIKRHGGKNIADLVDKYLERIPPAMMLPGDIGMPPSDPDAPGSKMGTVVIKVAGGGKYLGWHPDVPYLCVMDISQIDIAWRA